MSTNYYAAKDGEEYYEGVHLGKTAGGWKPYFQLHRHCQCNCTDEPYRNFGELCEYISQPQITVYNEYGEKLTVGEFIDKMIQWRKNASRSHVMEHDGVRISGWDFVEGNWS